MPTSLRTTAWPGSRYRFRVGRAGLWEYGASSLVVLRPAADVSLTGSWSVDPNFSSYGELPLYSTQAGARAALNLTVNAVAWIASGASARVRAVYLDGVRHSGRPLPLIHRSARSYSHSWTNFGSHAAHRRPGSPASHKRIDIDTLLVVAHWRSAFAVGLRAACWRRASRWLGGSSPRTGEPGRARSGPRPSLAPGWLSVAHRYGDHRSSHGIDRVRRGRRRS